MATDQRETEGVRVPAGEDGRRSTSSFGRSVLAEAIGPSDPAAAAAVVAETEWRSRYHRHFVAATAAGVASPNDAEGIARRGLEALHRTLRFVRAGEDRPLADVMAGYATGRAFDTAIVPGSPGPPRDYDVAYRGERLSGDRLRAQLETWVTAGVMEPSAAAGVEEVLDNPDWLDLSDLTVVVMGAGAELGPFPALMGMGARVAAIDLPSETIWSTLLERAGGRSTLMYPQRGGRTGADLTEDLPEVRDWIAELPGPIVLGGYAYADGAAHLRVAAAQDALIAHALATRPVAAVTVAHLLTPTDAYAVPEATAEAARRAWQERPLPLRLAQGGLRMATGDRVFRPAIEECLDGKDGYRAAVFDTLVTQQGPNYALAKRIQEWRAIVARADGARVSANIGPSSTTKSVTKNRALAAAYRGAGLFDIEVFEPNTTNALMALLLVRDLRTLTGPADPHVSLTNPLDLLSDCAVHGGLWRSPYVTRTALPLAALRGLLPF